MWRARFSTSDLLNLYWNSRGGAAPVALPADSQIDPTLVETLEGLYAWDDAQMPDARFLDRLEQTLLDTIALAPAMAPMTPTPSSHPNGHAALNTRPGPQSPRPMVLPRTRGWMAAQFATAALVLLTLIGSIAAFSGLRPAAHDDRPAIIPAWEGTPEIILPPGVTEDTVLLQHTFDVLPPNVFWVGIDRISAEPGVTWTHGTAQTTGVGPILYKVETGTATVRPDGPITITRAGTANAIAGAANTDSVLGPGDTAFLPSGVGSQWRNDGDQSVTVLDAGFAGPGHTIVQSGLTHTSPINDGPMTPPAMPASMTVRRVTLEPGASLPGKPEPGLKLVGVDAGTLTIVWAQRTNPTVPTGAHETRAGGWMDVNTADYFAKDLRNDGAEPLTLLVMTVTPVDASAATPTAQAPHTSESLLEVPFAGGEVAAPADSSNIWFFEHYAIDPGEHLAYANDCATPDLIVSYLLAGSYAVRPTGPLEVIRNTAAGTGAAGEQIAAGQQVELYPGDALVYRNTSGDHFAGFRNPGPDRLEVLEWQLYEQDCVKANPSRVDLLWDTWSFWDAATLDRVSFDPSRPFTLRLRKMTAAPGVELPMDGPDGPGFLAPGVPGLEVAGAEAGRVEVSSIPASVPYVSTTTSPPGGWVSGSTHLPAGSQRTIRSTGDEPLVLFALTIANTDGPGLPASPAALRPGFRNDTVLLQQTFDDISEQAAWVGTGRAVLEPGADWTLGKGVNGGAGPRAFVVETGALTVKADGPIAVTRSGSEDPIEVQPGTTVVLATGDRGYMVRDVNMRWRNDGTDRAIVLDMWITGLGLEALPDGVSHTPLIELWPVAKPKIPVTLTVHRHTLASGNRLAASQVPGLVGFHVEDGTLQVVDMGGSGVQAGAFAVPAGSGRTFGGPGYKTVPASWMLQPAGADPVTLLLMTMSDANPLEATPMGADLARRICSHRTSPSRRCAGCPRTPFPNPRRCDAHAP